MPTRWIGTREDRLARLDAQGRRCDGNSRHCTRSAVQRMVVARAGQPDASAQTKQTCGWHRKQFESTGLYRVLSSERMPEKIVPQPLWKRVERETSRRRASA